MGQCSKRVAKTAATALGRHSLQVFGPESSQERLYTGAIAPIVCEVLEGFNCTIFAYGQTGTGKTYTMEGGDRNSTDGRDLSEVAGVIPRAISQIFQHLDSINSEYTVKCSFLELYNEETTDLLAVGESKSNQKLRMLEDKSGVNVQGLEEIIVKSSADIYTLLDRGSAKRRTAETLLNKQSSRSHSVFCITVHMRETPTEGEDVIKVGKLYLVDLAGSENVGRSVQFTSGCLAEWLFVSCTVCILLGSKHMTESSYSCLPLNCPWEASHEHV